MKQQKMLWDQSSKENTMFWLEQGQCQQITAAALGADGSAKKCKAAVLLAQTAVEARSLRLPLADPRKTRQMLAMALQVSPKEAGHYKWRLIRQEAGEQWLFAVTCSAESLQSVRQAATNAGVEIKEIIGIYEALLGIWQQLPAEQKQAAETVLLYHVGDKMTLLFMRNGQPIHGQTMSTMQTAEDMAMAYKRTVNALTRQELWQQTQMVLYLEEGTEAELLARQLAVLAETKVLLLNEQPPFVQWQAEAAPLLIRSLLATMEKNDPLNGWQQSFGSSKQRRSRPLLACAVLVALAGVCWLGSAIWLQQAEEQAAKWQISVQQQDAPRVESHYGQVLAHIDTVKGKVTVQEIKLEKKGLMIYASAPDWSEAAAFGSRLEVLAEVSTMTITRSEKLQRLTNGQPEDFIALTIAITLEGGAPDEG